MEPDVLSPERALQALALFSAIPVVGLALWAERLKAHWDAIAKQQTGFDREAEQDKVRVASIIGMSLQLILFLASADSRDVYPVASNLILIAAVLLQFKIQSQLEKRLKPSVQWSPTGGEQVLGIVLRTMASWFVGLSIQLVTLFAFLRLSLSLSFTLGISQEWSVALPLALGLIGVGSGLVINFILGPLYMRAILPCEVVTEVEDLKWIHACFKKAEIHPATICLIHLHVFRVTSIAWVGLNFGRGPLHQTLFISRWVLGALSDIEMQAIILNQIAGVRLRHASKRFALTFLLITVTALVALGSILLAQRFVVNSVGIDLAGPIVAFFCFFVCVKILATQNRKHQALSDQYTVMQFGVSPDVLISAVIKLDQQLQPIPSQMVHPEAQLRVNALKKRFHIDIISSDKKVA